MKVLVVNPGATSTKLAVFEEDREVFKKSIVHSLEELRDFHAVTDQLPYRKALIWDTLAEAGFSPADFDAVCGRGGLLRHIPSGTYAVSEAVVRDLYHPLYGEHAANLGALLAKELADLSGCPAFFADPVCVDELSDLARISGCKGMERESFFHALNQKSMARKAAAQLGRPYEELNLIVVHLGGGVSVAAHEKGRVVDNFNVKDDGAMGLDRGGALPTNAVINLCFSGLSKAEVKKKLGSEAGVCSYLGTKNFMEIEDRALSGKDPEAELLFRALAYQLAKDIGAMAAVLRYQVDGIVLTGGMAYSKAFCREIASYVEKLAPILELPGENEMLALAVAALRVLHGEPPKDYEASILNR